MSTYLIEFRTTFAPEKPAELLKQEAASFSVGGPGILVFEDVFGAPIAYYTGVYRVTRETKPNDS